MSAPETLTFDPRFIRTCTFATLHTPGYGTRVTVYNGVLEPSPFATALTVSLSAFDRDGEHIGTSDPFLELAPGQIEKVDVDAILAAMVPRVGRELTDILGVLHMTPNRWLGETQVEVSPAELWAHARGTDDFVEFYSYRGHVVTGVAYQTGPMNDRRLTSTATTTIQAPKVIVRDNVDTLFLLMNVSTSFDYSGETTLKFKIMAPTGEMVAESSTVVPAWSFRLLSCRTVLSEAGALERFDELGGVGTLFGLALDGSLVPLSMTRNDDSGAIAVDHTLPPVYYVNKWGGALRQQGNSRLATELFAEAEKQPTVV